jgi:hypothetical protein
MIRLPLKTDLLIRIEDAVRPLVSRLSGDANETFFFFLHYTCVGGWFASTQATKTDSM